MYKFPGTSCIMSRNIASKKGQEIADGRPRTSSRVVYRYVALDEISARCSGEKFLKSTSALARESFDQPSTSVPSAENDNGQSLLMNKFRRIIAFTRRLLFSRCSRSRPRSRVRENVFLTRVSYKRHPFSSRHTLASN